MMLQLASLVSLNSSLWFKWEISFPGGIIPAERGEINSIGLSGLFDECYPHTGRLLSRGVHYDTVGSQAFCQVGKKGKFIVYQDLVRRFGDLLQLKQPPVGLTFVDSIPENVEHTGRRVPSACTFWRLADQGVIYATAADHHE